MDDPLSAGVQAALAAAFPWPWLTLRTRRRASCTGRAVAPPVEPPDLPSAPKAGRGGPSSRATPTGQRRIARSVRELTRGDSIVPDNGSCPGLGHSEQPG